MELCEQFIERRVVADRHERNEVGRIALVRLLLSSMVVAIKVFKDLPVKHIVLQPPAPNERLF